MSEQKFQLRDDIERRGIYYALKPGDVVTFQKVDNYGTAKYIRPDGKEDEIGEDIFDHDFALVEEKRTEEDLREACRKTKIRREKFVPPCHFCREKPSDYYANIEMYYSGMLPMVDGVCHSCKHATPLGIELIPVQEEWSKAERKHTPAKRHEEKPIEPHAGQKFRLRDDIERQGVYYVLKPGNVVTFHKINDCGSAKYIRPDGKEDGIKKEIFEHDFAIVEEEKDDEIKPLRYWSDRWLGADVCLLRPDGYSQRFMTDRFYVRDHKGIFVDLVCHDGREQKVEERQFLRDFALADDHNRAEELIGKKYKMKTDFVFLGNYGQLKDGDVVKIEGFEQIGDRVGKWNAVRFEDDIGSGNRISEEAFFHDFERVPTRLEDIVDVKIMTNTTKPEWSGATSEQILKNLRESIETRRPKLAEYNPDSAELTLDGHRIEGVASVDGIEKFGHSDESAVFDALASADRISFTEEGIEKAKAMVQAGLDRMAAEGVIASPQIGEFKVDKKNRTINFEIDTNVPIHTPGIDKVQRWDLEFDEEGDPKMYEKVKEALDKMIERTAIAGLIHLDKPKKTIELINEETHSFSMRFPNGDVVSVPPPSGDDWTETPILDAWTDRKPDQWSLKIGKIETVIQDRTPVSSHIVLNNDYEHIDDFEVNHESGVMMAVEYASRVYETDPELLSLSKWTRTVTVETKGDERAFPTLSGTFEV